MSHLYPNNFEGEYISIDGLKEIWDGNYVHPSINARYARLKICDCIGKYQRE